jgi:hypothetical protein
MRRLLVKKLLLAVGGAALTILVAAAAFAQNAGPPPEAFPPYTPDTSTNYWSKDQWRHDYSDAAECRFVRERILLPSGRVTFRMRRDCD